MNQYILGSIRHLPAELFIFRSRPNNSWTTRKPKPFMYEWRANPNEKWSKCIRMHDDVSQYIGTSTTKTNFYSQPYSPYPFYFPPYHNHPRPSVLTAQVPEEKVCARNGTLPSLSNYQFPQDPRRAAAQDPSRNLGNLDDLQRRALEVTGCPLINFNATATGATRDHHLHQSNTSEPNYNLFCISNNETVVHIDHVKSASQCIIDPNTKRCVTLSLSNGKEHNCSRNKKKWQRDAKTTANMRTSMKKYELLLGLDKTNFGKREEVQYGTEEKCSMGIKDDGSCTCCVYCCRECSYVEMGTSEAVPPLLQPLLTNEGRNRKNVFFKYFTQKNFERDRERLSYIGRAMYGNGEKECYHKKTDPSQKKIPYQKSLTTAKGSAQSTASCSNTLECSGISHSKNEGDDMTNTERHHELHFTVDDLFPHTSYFSKAPLRRTKESFVQTAANDHRVLDSKDYLSNNKDFLNDIANQGWKKKRKDDDSNDITNLNSNPVEIGVEDEDRFLPCNFFSDTMSTMNNTNDSNGTQKVTKK